MSNTLFDNESNNGQIPLNSEIIEFLKGFAEMEKGTAPSVGLTWNWIEKSRIILNDLGIKFKHKEGY